MTLTAARINSEECFSVLFSLSEASETDHFVARQDELDAMRKTLTDGPGRRAITLHGLGGIGKTQLAIAYAKTYRNKYSAIFWLNIKDEVSVKQSFSRIAGQILKEQPSVSDFKMITKDGSVDEAVIAVKNWLEHSKNTRWLMIFDNYDNPKIPGSKDSNVVDIQQFIPLAHHGSIIVTTRSSRVSVGRRLKISKLEDVRDGLQILSNASCREGVMDGELTFVMASGANVL